MKKYFINVVATLAVSLVLLGLPVMLGYMQVDAAPTGGVQGGLDGIKDSFPNTVVSKDSTPEQLAKKLIQYALYFGGIVAIVFVILGGYQYMTSLGNSDQAKTGRTTLVNALIGLVIIVFSFIIVQVVYKFIVAP